MAYSFVDALNKKTPHRRRKKKIKAHYHATIQDQIFH